MITRISLIIGILTSQVVFAQNLPNYVSPSNIEAWWSFEEDALDLSQNGRNGVISNVDFQDDYNLNPQSSAYFDGTASSYISINNSENLNFSGTDDYTIALWIFPNDNPNNGPHSGIISKWDEILQTTSYPYKIAATDLGNGFSELTWVNYSHTSSTMTQLNTTIDNNRYVHIAYVAKDNVVTLYINGNFESSIYYPPLNYSNNETVFIGKRETALNRQYKGKIDEIGIWSRALDECEIKALASFNSSFLIDIEVTNNNGVLTASSSAPLEPTTYQWYSCNNGIPEVIAGEVSADFEPTVPGEYYVELYFTNLDCSQSMGCFDSQTVSVENIETSTVSDYNFNMFPNPTSHTLNIQLNIEFSEVNSLDYIVYDMNGKIVSKGIIQNNNSTILLEGIQSGNYIFSIPNLSIREKFVLLD